MSRQSCTRVQRVNMSEYRGIFECLVDTFQRTNARRELTALSEQVTSERSALREHASYYEKFDGARAMVKYFAILELLDEYDNLQADIEVKLSVKDE